MAAWDGSEWTIDTDTDGTITAGDTPPNDDTDDHADADAGERAAGCVDLNDAARDELTDLDRIDGIGDARLDDILDEGLVCD